MIRRSGAVIIGESSDERADTWVVLRSNAIPLPDERIRHTGDITAVRR